MADDPESKTLVWFDRKIKAKFTLLAVILTTIGFYVCLFAGVTLEWFLYYAAFLSLLVGAMSAADVINTLSYNKSGRLNPDDSH